MRLIKVLAVTHVLAMLVIPLLFVSMLGWFIAEPPVEIGSFMFTCATQPQMDGTEIAGCFWSWK